MLRILEKSVRFSLDLGIGDLILGKVLEIREQGKRDKGHGMWNKGEKSGKSEQWAGEKEREMRLETRRRKQMKLSTKRKSTHLRGKTSFRTKARHSELVSESARIKAESSQSREQKHVIASHGQSPCEAIHFVQKDFSNDGVVENACHSELDSESA